MKKKTFRLQILAILTLCLLATSIPVFAMQRQDIGETMDVPYVHYYSVFISMPHPIPPVVFTADGEVYVHYYSIFLEYPCHEWVANLISREGITDALIEKLNGYGISIFSGEGLPYQEIDILSILSISCFTCGEWPVQLLRTQYGHWMFTGQMNPHPPQTHPDGTRSYRYERGITSEWRCVNTFCRREGIHVTIEPRWFNTFNRP